MQVHSLLQKVGQTAFFRRGTKEISQPILGDATRFPYGPFRFKTRLTPGARYRILASNDLTHWAPLCEGVASSDTLEYVDSEAPKFSFRVYRSMVDHLFSKNVIGYASVMLPPGFSLIANPFDSSSPVSEIFAAWPQGTTLSKFDARQLRLGENEVKNGKWTNPSERLLRGEGAIFFNPTDDYKSHSFVGIVAEGNLTMPIPSGFSLRSSSVPKHGDVRDDLKFPIVDGDVIHLFDRDSQKYVLHPFENGKWSAGPAIVSIGESFWIAKAAPANWTQTLIIPDS
jgi:hypothetical protein